MDTSTQSLKKAIAGLRKKEFSAVELTKAHLKRIRLFDKTINAFITVTEEKALNDAERADTLRARGEKQPLLGIPYTLKDVFSTSGIKTTAASKILENYIPPFDASVYRYVNEAGAVLLGKTNCDAFGHGSSTENSDFGTTKNPWDTQRVAGGSSGGSAASLAYGAGLFSIAEDTGGSIRQPAAFCGVTGLKPTWGVVSRYGCIAYASSLDTVGPMAHTADDNTIVFNIISKNDPLDASQIQHRSHKITRLGRLTIGVIREFMGSPNDAEIASALQKALAQCKELGHEIRDITIPAVKYAIECYYLLAVSEASSNLARYDGIRYGQSREYFNGENKRRIMLGTFALSAGYQEKYYLKAQKVRSVIAQVFRDAFRTVDALIAPVSPILPFPLGEKVSDPLQMYLADVYTVSANIAGIPSLALPCGFSKRSLPIGMQLMGSYYSEQLLLALGAQYQEATAWHTRRPVP